MSLLPTSKLLPDTSGTVDRRSVLSTQWSLSSLRHWTYLTFLSKTYLFILTNSVSLADNDDNNSDDDIKVQNSLRNIRGSARQRKMARNSQLSMFKAQTPQRDKRKETSDQTVDQSSDLSVLDILSEKRKQSREKMKFVEPDRRCGNELISESWSAGSIGCWSRWATLPRQPAPKLWSAQNRQLQPPHIILIKLSNQPK